MSHRSATSLGVVLAASALAFTIVKFIGAAYLVYLGIKLWRAPAFKLKEQPAIEASFGRRFIENDITFFATGYARSELALGAD
jgi:homoserine/homoserine lactone efflux protein